MSLDPRPERGLTMTGKIVGATLWMSWVCGPSISFSEKKYEAIKGFKHRTFKDEDFYWLMLILKRIYKEFGDFEGFWIHLKKHSHSDHFVQDFHHAFFDLESLTPQRSRKHIANGQKNSTCKRLLLFLRWAK